MSIESKPTPAEVEGGRVLNVAEPLKRRPSERREVTNDQRAWAAGFVESGAQLGPWKGGVSLRIMRKDPDPLYRLQDATEIGDVLEPQGDRLGRFVFVAYNEDAAELIRSLKPMLGPSWLERSGKLLHRVLGIDL